MWSSVITEIVSEFAGALQGFDAIREADPKSHPELKNKGEVLAALRGKPLYYPLLPTGRGQGPFIEMSDGSVKLDLITSIGIHIFGHAHPELILTAAAAALKCPLVQGTLMPGIEYVNLCEKLVSSSHDLPHLTEEAKAPLSGAWITTCGTMANEMALKIIRQKKHPAYKVITFKNSYSGRSSTMQELTDEPKYREGQPLFDQVSFLEFYSQELSLEENIDRTLKALEQIVKKEENVYCALLLEPIQGEGGGFRQGPREWWLRVLESARNLGLALWFDEIQTFGRTGELFAFQRMELGAYVDVVTLAKPLQVGAVLWREDYAARPGLLGGTYGSSTVSLSLALKTLELLIEGDYLGPTGRISRLEKFFIEDWKQRIQRLGPLVGKGRYNIYGGMVALEVLDAKAETVKNILTKLFESGVIAFSAGRNPVMLRFLAPVGILTEKHWMLGMDILEACLREYKT